MYFLMSIIFPLILLTTASGEQVNCNSFYNITDVESMEMMRYCPNSAFELKNDVVVKEDFVPINSFYGVLDGKNHTISNITINSGGYALGFFRTFNGIVRDLAMDIHIKSIRADSVFVGGFAGYMVPVIIQNVNITSRVTGGAEYCKECARKVIGGLCGATRSFPSNITVNSTIQVTLMSAYVGGLAGIVGIAEDGFPVTSLTSSTTNLTSNTNIRCLQSSCYAGALFGMTYQSITNSTVSGQIRISGMSDKATIAGGVVGLLMASLVDVNGKLTLLQVTTSGSSATNYVGGIVGTGNGTTFLSNRIDSCTVEIANFVSDFTVDYVGGILASSSNLQVTRTIIKITNLSSCLHTGGLVGLATLSDLRQCMVVVDMHNRSACRTPLLAESAQRKGIFFGGAVAVGIGDTFVHQSLINFTTIIGNYMESFIFGGLFGEGGKFLINSTAAAYAHINLTASEEVDSTLTFGGLVGYIWLKDDYISTIYGSYAVYGIANASLSCLNYNNSAIVGGLVGYIIQGYPTLMSNLTVRSSYTTMNASFYSGESCLTSSTFLYGGLFGLSYADIYFYNSYIQAILSLQMVGFKDFSPSGASAYGIGALLGKSLLSHTSIKGIFINLTPQIIASKASGTLSVPLYAGTSDFNNCLVCSLIYIVQNKYILSNEFTISQVISTEQSTYHFRFTEMGEWFFDSGKPVLQPLPNYELGSMSVSATTSIQWAGKMIVSDKISKIGWDCDYTFNYTQSTQSPPLLTFQYVDNQCDISNCKHCKKDDSKTCISCIASHYVLSGSQTCTKCQSECAICGTILPFPLPGAPSVCVTCPLGSLVASEAPANIDGTFCVQYPSCSVPNCIRCSCEDSWKCIKCTMGYYHNPEGYCTPCPLYCPLCTSSAGCLLCKDYDNMPVIGLCIYDVYEKGTNNICAVSIKNDSELCIACNTHDVGIVSHPNEEWQCKDIENSCKVTGCFNCVLDSETTCKVCQGGYVFNSITKGCDRCEAGCKTCLSPFHCLECLDGFTLANNTCFTTTECSRPACSLCNVYNPLYCLVCKEPYVIDRGYGLCIYPESTSMKNQTIILLITIPIVIIVVITVILVPIILYRNKKNRLLDNQLDGIDQILSSNN